MAEVPKATLVIMVATGTEEDQLKSAAREYGLRFSVKKGPAGGRFGRFVDMGRIGDYDTIAVKTDVGPLSDSGSAAKATWWMNATGAQGILSVGMAFGTRPGAQRLGDVLVSTSIIPYDRRIVRQSADGGSYVSDYEPATRYESRPQLLRHFEEELRADKRTFGVYFGALLSGAAEIRSATFRDELMNLVPQAADPIVGGEMEGVGFISVSNRADPSWLIVKGISDFADGVPDPDLETTRKSACLNAARFALAALVNAAKRRETP